MMDLAIASALIEPQCLTEPVSEVWWDNQWPENRHDQKTSVQIFVTEPRKEHHHQYANGPR